MQIAYEPTAIISNYNGRHMTPPLTEKNYFALYLRELRKSRGCENINEYLRQYLVPISHVHYRHLETGKRKISIEGAKELCDALRADPKIFYYNLLKDWLPEELMDFFVTLSGSEQDLPSENVYQRAVSRVSDAFVLFPDKSCCDYLNQHFELMPLVWFIYSAPTVTINQIAQIAKVNGITKPLEEIVRDFEQRGLIQIDSDQIIRKNKSSISFTHNELGAKILLHETQRCVSQYIQPRNPALQDSILLDSIMSISAKARQTIFYRIQDFLSKIREASADPELENPEPVFYSIVFAPRPQYGARPIREENIL